MLRQAVKAMVLSAALAAATSPAAHARGLGLSDVLGPAVELTNGLYEVKLRTGPPLLTHGPDAQQAGPPGDQAGSTSRRPPVCAPDFHQQVIYARPISAPDRYAQSRPIIEAAIFNMNAELDRAAMESGNRHADYRVKCDGGGELAIGNAVNPRTASFADVVDAVRLSGALDPYADFTIFYDDPTPTACGVGSYVRDDQPGPANESNRGGGYAVLYSDCWDGLTAMHENGHNLGAVHAGAPNAMGVQGHCRDEADVMCYPDGTEGAEGMLSTCPGGERFDCGYDDYFDTAPEPGEYLESHWNLGSPANHFISFSDPLAGEAVGEGACVAAGNALNYSLAVDTVGCPVATEGEPEQHDAEAEEPEPEPAVRIVGVVHHRDKQRVQARLACPASRSAPCRGRVLLARRASGGSGGRSFRLDAGESAAVRIPLAGAARRAWANGALRRVWVVARTDDAAGRAARSLRLGQWRTTRP